MKTLNYMLIVIAFCVAVTSAYYLGIKRGITHCNSELIRIQANDTMDDTFLPDSIGDDEIDEYKVTFFRYIMFFS